MKQIIALSSTLLTLALPAIADTPMTAEEFDAFVTGQTLYFGSSGQPYGAEEYLPNRQVRWSFMDGQCKDGYWYEEADLICFLYEDTPDPQCWSFFKTDTGLRALFENDPANTTLYEVNRSEQPMVCLGPEVGV
ncbi:MAG: hypothetical protein N4A70_01780 [Pelagimonas sp.]|jgi:hypothetical protein|nr:hypothetical protein [Pelagimonas sp.]